MCGKVWSIWLHRRNIAGILNLERSVVDVAASQEAGELPDGLLVNQAFDLGKA
jgi:hypothetical protein